MKTLRSNWNIINIIQPKMHTKGCGRFISKLDKISKVNYYKPNGIKVPIRIACVRFHGRNKYSAVGVGKIIEGNFVKLKETLKNAGFTGIRMGAIKVNL